MADCSRIDALVTPFVDGELPTTEREAIAGHIAACPPCRAKVAAERAVRGLIQSRRVELCAGASPTLKARCARMASLCDGNRRARAAGRSQALPGAAVTSGWRSRIVQLGMAAVLAIGVGGLVYLTTETSPQLLAAELSADHEKCFRLNALLGTNETPETVEAKMASGFGWHMHMPDVAAHRDITVVGSRPCIYGEGKTAHIMFTRNGEPVSLFMLKRSGRSDQAVEIFGHQCRIWTDGDRTFALVARSSTVPLDEMAAFVRTTIH